jgi:hypothetical protein
LPHNFRLESLFTFNPETFLNIFAATGGHARDGWSALQRFLTLILEITVDYDLVSKNDVSVCRLWWQSLL